MAHPFTAALRVQRMPFRNVYEPDLTLRYHMAGDVFAALFQSLSFARMNASRALSVAHDLQSALLVGSIAMIFRARTPWSPIVAALAAAVPFLVGPMGYYYGAMGMYQGFADFSNFTLSFRPHCMLSLLMLVGFVAWVVGFTERTNRRPRHARAPPCSVCCRSSACRRSPTRCRPPWSASRWPCCGCGGRI